MVAAEGATSTPTTTYPIILRSIDRENKAQKGPRTFLGAQGRPDSSLPRYPTQSGNPQFIARHLPVARQGEHLPGGQAEAHLVWPGGNGTEPWRKPTSSTTQDGEPPRKGACGLCTPSGTQSHPSAKREPRGKEVKGLAPLPSSATGQGPKSSHFLPDERNGFSQAGALTAQRGDAVLGPQSTRWWEARYVLGHGKEAPGTSLAQSLMVRVGL